MASNDQSGLHLGTMTGWDPPTMQQDGSSVDMAVDLIVGGAPNIGDRCLWGWVGRLIVVLNLEGGIVVVNHGSADGAVRPPHTAVARWVGSGTYSAAVDYDDVYADDV